MSARSASAQETAFEERPLKKTVAATGTAVEGVLSGAEGRAKKTGASSPDPLQAGTPYLDRGMNEFGVWGGGSFSSPTLIGTAENARFAVVGLRYARVLAAGANGLALKYTADVVPLAALSYERSLFVQTSLNPDVFRLERDRETAYGAGLSPFGLQLNFRRSKRVQPFAAGSVGFIYFGETVPDERSALEPGRSGKQFNFTTDFGGGVQVFTGERRALTFGYRFHHLSNGYRGEINPGFDANLFYAGYSFFK